jgi:DNA helicase HerA-like ATPase
MDPIQAAVTELLIAIAGEGRKYGLYLFLATQRPDKLHPNVISPV